MFNPLKPSLSLSKGDAGGGGLPRYLGATVAEGGDAPAALVGNPIMTIGDRFEGRIGVLGDTDTIAVQLEGGQSYVFTAFGTNGATLGLSDPTLTIRNPNGVQVAFNDDIAPSNTFSGIAFTAAETGTYFLTVGAFGNRGLGTYALTAAPAVFAVDQVASFLTEMAWGITTPIHFAETVGGIITYDLSNLTASGASLAEWAFEAWSAVTGIVFQAGAASSADIVFFDGVNDQQPAQFSSAFPTDASGAYAGPASYNPVTGIINLAAVNIGVNWVNTYGTSIDSYSFQTYLHEIGHALGLGHAGPYDGSATFGTHNLYLNDSVQMSIMSYFSPSENTFVPGNDGIVITPMIADIQAIQRLYGPAPIHAGNTVWGSGSNLSGYLGDVMRILFDGATDVDGLLQRGENMILTIADTEGIDTLDFSTNNTASRIDLREGAVSDLFGVVGNMVISVGTIIENVNLGGGNDTVVGNAADNRISGGLGDDSIDGGDGIDTAVINTTFASISSITYNAGLVTVISSQGIDRLLNIEILEFTDQQIAVSSLPGASPIQGTETADTLTGTGADDVLFGLGGDDVLFGGLGNDSLFGGGANDRLDGGTGNDTLVGGSGDDLYLIDSPGDQVFETTEITGTLDAGGDDTVESAVTFDLNAHVGVQFVEHLVLTGSAQIDGFGNDLDNRLTGNSGHNLLRGGRGNDTLDGSVGHDTMFGGEGDDTYVVDSVLDRVIETTTDGSLIDSGGYDTVRSAVSFSLGAYSGVRLVERLILSGGAHISGTGNALNNVLIGNSGNNLLNGGLGTDTMAGGAGNDTYMVDAIFDRVDETTNGTSDAGGMDTVISTVTYNLDAFAEVRFVERLFLAGSAHINAFGNGLHNVLVGNAGNNILNGGLGNDTMTGGAGNDTYYVNSVEDRVFEFGLGLVDAGGTDTVVTVVTFSLDAYLGVRFVENLILTGAAHINAIGNLRNNVLIGNAGNNLLNGGIGNDTMRGGAGNDIYVVDSAGDQVFETTTALTDAGGFDVVLSSVSFNLGAYIGVSFVEQLNLVGTADINAFGNALNNILIGNAGNNLLNGGLGNDTMYGGAGDDTYVIDATGDQIFEVAGGGFDTVLSSISINLDAYGGIRMVEQVNLTGSSNIDARGNSQNNILVGNSGNNRLNGGLGEDTMIGGAGQDTFVFNTSLGTGNVDRILDFDAGNDLIELDHAVFAGLTMGLLAEASFLSNDTGLADNSLTQIIYETDTGNLYFDVDGNGPGTSIRFATLSPNLILTGADFLIV